MDRIIQPSRETAREPCVWWVQLGVRVGTRAGSGHSLDGAVGFGGEGSNLPASGEGVLHLLRAQQGLVDCGVAHDCSHAGLERFIYQAMRWAGMGEWIAIVRAPDSSLRISLIPTSLNSATNAGRSLTRIDAIWPLPHPFNVAVRSAPGCHIANSPMTSPYSQPRCHAR